MGARVIQGFFRQYRSCMGIGLLLLFTLVLRSGLMIAQFQQLQADPDDYYLIASNVLHFATFSIDDPTQLGAEMRPSAYRPPLYPILLSNLAIGPDKVIRREAIAVVHIVLALATVWLTWRIARSLNLGWGSYVAGFVVACDPILILYQSQVMTETLATFCSVLAWGLLVRFHFDRNWWNAGLAGGAIGIAALCRPAFLPWMAASALVVLLLQPGKFNTEPAGSKQPPRWELRGLNALAVLVAGLGVMFPWAWRNYQQFQKPILTTTHGGYTLYLANNRFFYRYLREDQSGLPWNPQERVEWKEPGLSYFRSFRDERRLLLWFSPNAPLPTSDVDDERVLDHYQNKFALEAMQADPTGFVMAALFRIRQMWTPLAYRTTADESTARMLLRFAAAVWYCGVYALVLAGLYFLRRDALRSPWVFGVALCLIFTAVHTLYWCNLRMRAPLMPFVAVVAAAGATHGSRREKRDP
jgi:hypothetical protein